MFLPGFGNMYLQAKAIREREFRYIAPHGGIACVFGMDGCIHTDAAVSCAVEVPDQRARFLNGAICFRIISGFVEGEYGV